MVGTPALAVPKGGAGARKAVARVITGMEVARPLVEPPAGAAWYDPRTRAPDPVVASAARDGYAGASTGAGSGDSVGVDCPDSSGSEEPGYGDGGPAKLIPVVGEVR